MPCGAAVQLSAGATLAPLQVYLASIGAPSRHGAVMVKAATAVVVVGVVVVVVVVVLVVDELSVTGVDSWSVSTVSKNAPPSVGKAWVVGAADVLTLPFWLGRAGRISRPS